MIVHGTAGSPEELGTAPVPPGLPEAVWDALDEPARHRVLGCYHDASSRIPGPALLRALPFVTLPAHRRLLAEAVVELDIVLACDAVSVSRDPEVVALLVDALFDNFRAGSSVALSFVLRNRIHAHDLLRANLDLPSATRVRLARFLPHSRMVIFLLTGPFLGGAHPGEGESLFRSMFDDPFQGDAAAVFVSAPRIADTVATWFATTSIHLDPARTSEFSGFLHAAFQVMPARELYAHRSVAVTDGVLADAIAHTVATFPAGCTSPACPDPDRRAARAALITHLAPDHPGPLSEVIAGAHVLICGS